MFGCRSLNMAQIQKLNCAKVADERIQLSAAGLTFDYAYNLLLHMRQKVKP